MILLSATASFFTTHKCYRMYAEILPPLFQNNNLQVQIIFHKKYFQLPNFMEYNIIIVNKNQKRE